MTLKYCFFKGNKHALEPTSKPNDRAKEDGDEVVKRMKAGLLDPTKSMHSLYAEVDASVRIKDEIKLDFLRRVLSEDPLFGSVLLNADRSKLILRSKSLPLLEAFCFVRWDLTEHGSEHHAVVSCADETFRSEVLHAIQNIFMGNLRADDAELENDSILSMKAVG